MGKCLYGNSFIKITPSGILLDQVPLKDLTQQVSSPFFIFFQNKLSENIQRLRSIGNSIFSNFRIVYSIKANYLVPILKEIDAISVPFELISEYEYAILKRESLSTENLIVGGPYLPDSFITEIIKEKNPIFVIYSIGQAHRLDKIAKKAETTVKALVRFTAPKSESHLGLSLNDTTLNHLEQVTHSCGNIELIGVNSHYGTQLNSRDSYVKNAHYLAEITRVLESKGIFIPKMLNLGGGFPNASVIKNSQLVTILSDIKNELNQFGYSNLEIIFEPGRYIVEDIGVFIMNLIEVSDCSHSLYVNAGTNFLPRFARNSLRFYNADQPISHYNNQVTIYGNIPSEEEILTKNYNFSSINHVGDHILVLNCGAYCITFSNRFPYKKPKIVFIYGSSFTVHEMDFP